MIGFALVLIPVGYVLAYTGLAGDGTAQPGSPKTFSLGTAFKNAVSGAFTHGPLTQKSDGKTPPATSGNPAGSNPNG